MIYLTDILKGTFVGFVLCSFLIIVLFISSVFLGFFPTSAESLNPIVTIDFNELKSDSIYVDAVAQYTSRVYKSYGSQYYDRVSFNYKLKGVGVKGRNFAEKIYDWFALPHIQLIYDISEYEFESLSEFNSYITNGNSILCDRTNYVNGYILPQLLTRVDKTVVIRPKDWLPDYIDEERGESPPYYSIHFVSWYTELIEYNDSGQVSQHIGYIEYDRPYIELKFSSYQIFKGVFGGLGITVDSSQIPIFDYDIDNFGDLFGLFKYIFTYIFQWGDIIRNTISSMFYGFIPVYFFFGGS